MPDNSSETSGTPGYMCPEVMNGKKKKIILFLLIIFQLG